MNIKYSFYKNNTHFKVKYWQCLTSTRLSVSVYYDLNEKYPVCVKAVIILLRPFAVCSVLCAGSNQLEVDGTNDKMQK
jgi:hypothetical protein